MASSALRCFGTDSSAKKSKSLKSGRSVLCSAAAEISESALEALSIVTSKSSSVGSSSNMEEKNKDAGALALQEKETKPVEAVEQAAPPAVEQAASPVASGGPPASEETSKEESEVGSPETVAQPETTNGSSSDTAAAAKSGNRKTLAASFSGLRRKPAAMPSLNAAKGFAARFSPVKSNSSNKLESKPDEGPSSEVNGAERAPSVAQPPTDDAIKAKNSGEEVSPSAQPNEASTDATVAKDQSYPGPTNHSGREWTDPERLFATTCVLPVFHDADNLTGKDSKVSAPTTPTWSPIRASKFKVRDGPDYNKNKKKNPSLDSLYDVSLIRMYRSGSRSSKGVLDMFPLPPLHTSAEGDEKGSPLLGSDHVPDWLIFRVYLPHDGPNMFRQVDDGNGSEFVMYMRPSLRFAEEYLGQRKRTSATDLFVKWCTKADVNPEMRMRFKAVAMVQNFEKHGMLQWLRPYNGKPVLITHSGSVRKGLVPGTEDGPSPIRYLEMSANIHMWSFISKKSFVSLIPAFKDLRLDFGFTIEALEDSEMPECILGGMTVNYVHALKVPLIDPSMCHEQKTGGGARNGSAPGGLGVGRGEATNEKPAWRKSLMKRYESTG